MPTDRLKKLEELLRANMEAGWPDNGRRLPEEPAPSQEQPQPGEVQATLQFGWKTAKGPPLQKRQTPATPTNKE